MKQYIPVRKSKGTEMKFVTGILTPTNPKDIFHQNIESLTMKYLILILIGLGMILYMIVY